MHPIPGKDAQWIGYCPKCDDSELHASRGGFRNGGIQHCYGCGHEREIKGFKECDIKSMVLSNKYHWQKYPLLPFNWHLLSESQKWSLLSPKSSEGL